MVDLEKRKEINQQLTIPLLHAEVHKTTSDGIEMGVLENGMPYLSQRGLIAMAGIPRTTFQVLTNNWSSKKYSDETAIGINKLLEENGYYEDDLYIEIEQNGRKTYAYTEPVCLAVLEYHAFDAKKTSETAQKSFRTLSKAGFRMFVYEYTGYKPQNEFLDSWKHFHDRVDLVHNAAPSGYYCIFQEIAGMIVSLIRQDVLINDKVVPDISVGIAWAKYWSSGKLSEAYGDRVKYEHNYPSYYPQAASNPQKANAYPNESLHIFREWFENTYIKTKFPQYILNQCEKRKIDKAIAAKAVETLKTTANN